MEVREAYIETLKDTLKQLNGESDVRMYRKSGSGDKELVTNLEFSQLTNITEVQFFHKGKPIVTVQDTFITEITNQIKAKMIQEIMGNRFSTYNLETYHANTNFAKTVKE